MALASRRPRDTPMISKRLRSWRSSKPPIAVAMGCSETQSSRMRSAACRPPWPWNGRMVSAGAAREFEGSLRRPSTGRRHRSRGPAPTGDWLNFPRQDRRAPLPRPRRPESNRPWPVGKCRACCAQVYGRVPAPFIAPHRLFQPVQPGQRKTAIEERLRVIRHDRREPVAAVQRFVVTPKRLQRGNTLLERVAVPSGAMASASSQIASASSARPSMRRAAPQLLSAAARSGATSSACRWHASASS